MKKYDLHNWKSIIKYIIYITSVVTACYGFWGCLFPELTLVGGTYRVVYEAEADTSLQESSVDFVEEYVPYENGGEDMASGLRTARDAERLYADILEGRVTVLYRSRLWEFIKSKCGLENGL